MGWRIILLLYLSSIIFVIAKAQNPIGLKALAALRGFPIGASATVNNLRNYVDNGEYNWKIANNYQLVVPEGELKPRSIWFGENIYNWTDADWLLGDTPNTTGWIQKNQMQLRGHNLVWALDQCTPDWLLKAEPSITSDKARQLLSDYIHAVVGRYRGKIHWWDVVNEAIDNDNNTNPLNLRNCFWLRKLGPDFIKYAFTFALEADPDLQLYYNEYNIESLGLKASRTIDLIKWVRSQGATVHGIGLQWHINVSTNVTPGDAHYQSAQQFIDQNLDIMVTELDVAMPTRGGYPVDANDLDRQGLIYRSLMQYVLYFSYHCKAMLTWGLTDRYSWLPYVTKKTQGAALPFDWMYEPKPAYWQMQEEMGRVIADGVYILSPESQPDRCLGISQNTSSSDVQLYSGTCNNAYQQWNITWFADGTYRFSSVSDNNRVLGTYNTTALIGGVRTYNWSNDVSQEWAFSPQKNNTFRTVPRTAWWRVMNVYNTSNIGIVNYNMSAPQNWILTTV